MEESQKDERGGEYSLIVRKGYYGLATACPNCLPVYIYLKLARFPFRLDFNSTYPDSDKIPYLECGTYVAYNNENGGVIQRLKEDGIVNLDSEFTSIPEWISMQAMVTSWLLDALTYELWLGSDNGTSAFKIYYSDLPWLIGKPLFFMQVHTLKQRLGITKENAERRENEIYKRAKIAYEALSTRLGDQEFLFDDRPSSLDAFLIGHVLFTVQALPETSHLRRSLLEHDNLVRYAEKHKTNFLEASSSSSAPQFQSYASSTPSRGPSNSSSKPKRKHKREKTEEEKTFKRRAKLFVVTQVVAILLFLSLMGVSDVEVGDDDEGYGYD